MKTATVKIKGVSPYSASRMHDTPKLEKERPDDYENRTWREKLTTDENGIVCIPGMAFKQALDRAATVLGHQIPGKGKATFKKHFVSGCIVTSDVSLGIDKKSVSSITINANADGVRGSGKRVKRTFPVVPKWEGAVVFAILDETITRTVFEEHIKAVGMLVGVGRFRPENGGMNGRFEVVSIDWR
jgi:hypothetical protein